MSEPTLFRVKLIRLREQQFHVVLSCHHILLDAWCWSLILMDFFAYYRERTLGVPFDRPTPRPYRDFVMRLARQDRQAAREYWREKLEGFDSVTPLPMQERSDTGTVSAVTDVSVSLSPEMSRRLQELAQHHQLTVNTVIQGAWALLLSKYAHRSDVLFGVTVAGRPAELAGIQETVGIFVNTLPLRVQVPEPGSAQTVIGWLKSVLAQNVQMRRHEHLPLSEIQSLSAMPRGQSLFDSFVVFENAPGDAALGGHAQEVSAQLRKTRTHTNYPITVMVLPGTQLQLHVIYQRALFDHELIQQLARHFLAVVEACVANPLRTVSDLPMLSAEEVEQGLSAGEGAASYRGSGSQLRAAVRGAGAAARAAYRRALWNG